jgi:putative redox protein
MFATLKWKSGMHFECQNQSQIVSIDAVPEHGGQNLGPSPKELVLDAMMGCTAIDCMSMLTKMRQEITDFRMEISAEKTTEFPIHFKSAILKYYFQGNADPEKIKKSVTKSLTLYCGVNYMIGQSCEISFEVFHNDALILKGPVEFAKGV